jgi:hypothetical protein
MAATAERDPKVSIIQMLKDLLVAHGVGEVTQVGKPPTTQRQGQQQRPSS